MGKKKQRSTFKKKVLGAAVSTVAVVACRMITGEGVLRKDIREYLPDRRGTQKTR